MPDNNSNTLSTVEAILATGITNAYYANLLRLHQQGKDTNDQQIAKECMKQVFSFYKYAQEQVKKNQLS
jgi:hypothetical protein